MVRALIPVLLAALGGDRSICAPAGVFNIALEGLMLTGTFAAVTGSYFAGSASVGVLIAVIASTSLSLVLAFGRSTRNGDPIVLGVALNLAAIGVTGFLLVALFDVRGVFQDAAIVGLPTWRIPGLASIPLIGEGLFDLTPLGYLAPSSCRSPMSSCFELRWTPAPKVGERPHSASSLGVSPKNYQYGAVMVSVRRAGSQGPSCPSATSSSSPRT